MYLNKGLYPLTLAGDGVASGESWQEWRVLAGPRAVPGSSCCPLAPVASPGRTAVLWGREEPPVQDSNASHLHTLQRSLCASPAS